MCLYIFCEILNGTFVAALLNNLCERAVACSCFGDIRESEYTVAVWKLNACIQSAILRPISCGGAPGVSAAAEPNGQ